MSLPHSTRRYNTLPGDVSFTTSAFPHLDIGADNGQSLPHNNAICSLLSHPLYHGRVFPKELKNLSFGYCAVHKIHPKITGQYTFEVLFYQINPSPCTINDKGSIPSTISSTTNTSPPFLHHLHNPLPQPQHPHPKRIFRKDEQMPEAIPGIVPKRDGLVHNHGILLIIALVPVMAEVAGLQDEGEDARCFSAPHPVGSIQGQGLDRHSKIIDRKGGKGLPFTH